MVTSILLRVTNPKVMFQNVEPTTITTTFAITTTYSRTLLTHATPSTLITRTYLTATFTIAFWPLLILVKDNQRPTVSKAIKT